MVDKRCLVFLTVVIVGAIFSMSYLVPYRRLQFHNYIDAFSNKFHEALVKNVTTQLPTRTLKWKTDFPYKETNPTITDYPSKETENTTRNYPYQANCTASFILQHYMTIQKPEGRLGNNVFKLLMLLGTAIDHCYNPVITNKFAESLNQVFDLSFMTTITNIPGHWSVFEEYSDTIYSKEVETLDHGKNWTFRGYFQSWRYSKKYIDFIKSKLKFKSHITDAVSKYLDNTTKLINKTKICAHLRRGDFLGPAYQNVGFASANVGFFIRASEYLRNILKEDSLAFIYLSDDIEWCQKNIRHKDIHYSPFSSDKSMDSAGKDMALMSFCDHHIVSSGSFGWTGAWLGRGKVVYFQGYPTPGSARDQHTNRCDYYPANWVGMF